MGTTGLRTWLVVVACVVLVVLFFDSSGVQSEEGEVIIDDAAQLGAGLAAATVCWWTSRRVTGVERTWRRLMAVGMLGWSVGQAFWSWYQIFSDTPLPSPSIADIGYLTMPVLALPALLALDVEPPRHSGQVLRRDRLVFSLDGAIVVGSLFILTWATALGAVVHTETPNVPALAVAIAYPLTDLILVVIVVLLIATGRVPRQLRPQLWLLGAGLVGLSVSDSIFACLVSSGADEMPPLTNAGFIAGPLLIAVAALATADGWPAARHLRPRVAVDRAHLLLPYALVALTAAVVAAQIAIGSEIDALEATVAGAVLVLVLVRQVVTLIENAALLERVSAAQAELAHQAHHDPLTGLANRALFDKQLDHAIERHHAYGWPFALIVVDLDDFKVVNDTFGHATGDYLLSAVGQRLRGCVRSGDTVARLGGDEFAIVIDGDGDVVAERVLAALRQPFRIDGHIVALGGSLGVVAPQRREAGVTADALVHRADSAMYAGKRRGKGIAIHYRPDATPDVGLGPRQADLRGRPVAPRAVPGFPEVVPDVPRRRSGIGSVRTPTH
jgi:diguanylate cyclase (GGDEF)-like protein